MFKHLSLFKQNSNQQDCEYDIYAGQQFTDHSSMQIETPEQEDNPDEINRENGISKNSTVQLKAKLIADDKDQNSDSNSDSESNFNKLINHLSIFKKDSYQQVIYTDQNGHSEFTDDYSFMQIEPPYEIYRENISKNSTVQLKAKLIADDEDQNSDSDSDSDSDSESNLNSDKNHNPYELSYSIGLFPGDLKNIAKTFLSGLQKFIQNSFSKEQIENNNTLNVFVQLKQRNKDNLIEFLNTNIGYQLCQLYFGNFKFVKGSIQNQKVRVDSLIKAVKMYFILSENL